MKYLLFVPLVALITGCGGGIEGGLFGTKGRIDWEVESGLISGFDAPSENDNTSLFEATEEELGRALTDEEKTEINKGEETDG